MPRPSILLIVLSLVLFACGDDNGTETTLEPVAEPQCIDPIDDGNQPEFVGLNESAARDLAEERGLEVREVGRDGECFPVTDDLRDDRINLEFRGDQVVGAAIY